MSSNPLQALNPPSPCRLRSSSVRSFGRGPGVVTRGRLLQLERVTLTPSHSSHSSSSTQPQVRCSSTCCCLCCWLEAGTGAEWQPDSSCIVELLKTADVLAGWLSTQLPLALVSWPAPPVPGCQLVDEPNNFCCCGCSCCCVCSGGCCCCCWEAPAAAAAAAASVERTPHGPLSMLSGGTPAIEATDQTRKRPGKPCE